ncbi:uncharacterized protein LOC112556192 isoform X2 [Pomacea canaliculata]|uniref:uncharacterized protein LOC112556192 isoform X2 n=1 Tax=Pomacea canaliculata TaxID=400727 RepID=UPI000D72DDDB|nr:uncharacterized protein LOC112556192 isoform X2 [Pomacea canaliculata]XP_025080755.1 uncharacterized protein LOC112556192 isoform X2 [Pomacea canaliculata]XP_025080756.1 uncharacterized protein LOC112556192 isoform X2 [Pomacea canaliculata]
MDTMFILILCLMVACSQAGLNDISLRDMLEDEEFVDHASRVVQAADAAGYEVAALYGESLETGEHRRLTKRDIEAHVAHPSTESRNFQLRLTSGERLHMSLTKRSVLAPDLTVVERLQNGTGKSRPQVRDCFFSGSLESGHASLSLCDGKVTGAIHSKDRDIQLHPLPEDVAWNHHDEGDPPLLMLLTWSNVTDDEPPSPADFIEVQENDTKYNSKKPKGKRSVKDKNMTIEVGVYLDRLFIKKVQESLGISSNQELTELIAAKWSGISGVLNSPSMRQYGWNINIKIVSLEIWRKNPSWYNDSLRALGQRLKMVCENTQRQPFDYVSIETAETDVMKRRGLAYLRTICEPRWRCGITKERADSLCLRSMSWATAWG